MEYDRLEHLVGVRDEKLMKKTLGTFWARFKERNPEHVAFTRGPSFPLESLIPVLFHGDEGRGLKKRQIMILSTHGVLGMGSRRHPEASNESKDPLKMNYLGSTWKNHFLLCCLPISLYGNDPSALFQMLDIQAAEFSRLFWDGVEFGGRRLYIACVGIKGDSPFLSKAGMFNRAFTRRPTRATSKTPCKGICHLCMAGCESYDHDVPYEDVGLEFPAWLGTVGLVKPFTTPSPLLKIPFHQGGTTEALFEFDLFHNFHQGVGKNFAASAICICLELVRRSISDAFDQLTSDFKQYCSEKRESPYHKSITAKLLGVDQSFQDCPDAAWSKGDFTRLILKWFDDYCKRCVVGHTLDPLYLKCVPSLGKVLFVCFILSCCFSNRLIFQFFIWAKPTFPSQPGFASEAEAVSNINMCMSGLYREGLFIGSERARQIATHGLQFLRAYVELAGLCFSKNKKRFPLTPKGHYLHHQFLGLLHQSQKQTWCLNVVAFGVQMEEDFIGKPSRLARRVSCKTTSLRVIERAFLAMNAAMGRDDIHSDDQESGW